MERNQEKNKEKLTRGRSAPEVTAFTMYQMKRRGISLKDLSKKFGVSFQMVCHVIWLRRGSSWIREAIAKELGYENWQELSQAATDKAASA